MKSLVIGGSSTLGSHIIKKKKLYDFTFFKKKIKNGIKFDILSDDKKILNIENYNSIILLSSISNPKICEEDKTYSEKINVEATIDLIKFISEKDKKIIFFSSEFIYDGVKGNYDEFDDPNPINLYGQQKLKVENFIRNNVDNYSILRVAKTYSNNFLENSFFSFFYSELVKKKKKEIPIVTDEFFSAIHIDDLIWVVEYSILNNINLINTGGPLKTSRMQCLKEFLKFTNLKGIKIKPYIRKKENNGLLIPKDVSFNVNKLREIKKNMLTINDFLKTINEKNFNTTT